MAKTVYTVNSVCGKIERVIFTNKVSKFTVLRVKDYDRSLVGNIDNPLVGERVTFQGTEGEHHKYGPQFLFTSYEREKLTNTKHIYDYIVKVAKWVGPVAGKEIIDNYGSDALKILKDEPKRIAKEIKRITITRAKELSQALKDNEAREKVQLGLNKLCAGILSSYTITRIIARYEGAALDVIKDNPYKLMDIKGIGFKKCDALAMKLGLPVSDNRRHSAALVSLLGYRFGDTRVDVKTMYAGAHELLGMNLTDDGINYAIAKGMVVRTGNFFALRNFYDAEQSIAYHINRLIKEAKDKLPDEVDFSDCYDDQLSAISLVKENPVAILTGPPGTGKTWTLGTLIQGYIDAKYKVAFCAPTGKAAKRMTEVLSETCGGRASTIHRLLGMVPPNDDSATWTYSHTASNPLNVDYVVVDEVSMLDIHLASALFEAIDSGARLLLIGDDNQLPSVGPGSVLRDLIAAGVPTARLHEIKRNHGDIVVSCHQIKDGKVPVPNPEPLDAERGHNWGHVELASKERIAQYIVTLVTELLNNGIDLENIMVISPFNHMNSRSLSCKDLNERLQTVLNRTPDIKVGALNVNDRVVRLLNDVVPSEDDDEDIMVVNGDIGEILDVVYDDNGVEDYYITRFYDPERTVKLDAGRHELALAYALSCHKMQGSESDYIIMPLHPDFGRFPNREWVYTAFSRAKTFLFTVGVHSVLHDWVSRVGNALRTTNLHELMNKFKNLEEAKDD